MQMCRCYMTQHVKGMTVSTISLEYCGSWNIIHTHTLIPRYPQCSKAIVVERAELICQLRQAPLGHCLNCFLTHWWIQWFIVNCLGINIQLGDTKLWCLNTNYCQSISIAHIKCHLDYSLHRAVRRPLPHALIPVLWIWASLYFAFTVQLNEPNQTQDTVSWILWVSLSSPALKSIRSTGYECQRDFVELACILSLLRYKGEPQLQEGADLLWFCTGINNPAQPEWKERGHGNARKSKTTF